MIKESGSSLNQDIRLGRFCPERSQSFQDRRWLRRRCCRPHTQIEALLGPLRSDEFGHPGEVVAIDSMMLTVMVEPSPKLIRSSDPFRAKL